LFEANRKAHELERELITVRISNAHLHETNNAKDQEMLELEDTDWSAGVGDAFWIIHPSFRATTVVQFMA